MKRFDKLPSARSRVPSALPAGGRGWSGSAAARMCHAKGSVVGTRE